MASTSPQLDGLVTALVSADTRDEPSSRGREEVLDAALSAFLEFGIRRTSMGDIARRSGVSQATLYRWFGTKDEIVRAVFLRDLRQFTADLDSLVAADSPPDVQLTELTMAVARRLDAQRLVHRLIETEPESILPQLTSGAGPLIELGVAYLGAFIQRFVDEGRIEPVDPAPLAEIFIRLFHSLTLTPTTSFPLDDEERLRAFARATIRGLLRMPARTDPMQAKS